MGQKILGLDIGSYSIKAAIFDVSFRSFNLTDLYESSPLNLEGVEGEEKIKSIGASLKTLVADNNIHTDKAITAIAGTLISTRALTMPLDKKKLDRVLPFELESYLPFPLDELIIDRHTITTSKTQTSVLAIAVKKEAIREHLTILKEAKIDPKALDVDLFSLSNVYHILNLNPDETVALIDIGHSKTLISIISGGNLELARTLLTGGKNLTNALRVNLDLTFEQAEEVKLKYGILDIEESPALKQDIKKISETLKNAVDPLTEEIRHTMQSYKAQISPESRETKGVKKIFICGGTSLLKNIDKYFTSKTGIETEFLHCFPPEHEISQKLGNRERVLANSIGLGLKEALKGQKKNISEINLRKGEFTYQQEFKNIRGRVSFAGTWLMILLAVVLLNFSVKYYRLSVKSAKIDKEILKIFTDTVDDYPKGQITSGDKALTIMKERMKKFKSQIDVLTAGLKELSALSILREISARIPSDVVVDVQELNIFKNTVAIRGETTSFASVDRIIANLSKFEPFTKVEKGEVSDAPNPEKKKFSINITIGESKD